MVFYSNYYEHQTLEYQECYKYAIVPFGAKDFLKGFIINIDGQFVFSVEFNEEQMRAFAKCVCNDGYILIGYRIEVSGGDPYDRLVPIAVSSELVELKVLADLNCLDPLEIVNKKILPLI